MDHHDDFLAALRACQTAQRCPTNREWKSLLFLLTALPGLWQAIGPALDFHCHRIHLEPDRIAALSTGEHLLLQAAMSLFDGSGRPQLAQLATYLDAPRWKAFLDALWLYRTDRIPLHVTSGKEHPHAAAQ